LVYNIFLALLLLSAANQLEIRTCDTIHSYEKSIFVYIKKTHNLDLISLQISLLCSHSTFLLTCLITHNLTMLQRRMISLMEIWYNNN